MNGKFINHLRDCESGHLKMYRFSENLIHESPNGPPWFNTVVEIVCLYMKICIFVEKKFTKSNELTNEWGW